MSKRIKFFVSMLLFLSGISAFANDAAIDSTCCQSSSSKWSCVNAQNKGWREKLTGGDSVTVTVRCLHRYGKWGYIVPDKGIKVGGEGMSCTSFSPNKTIFDRSRVAMCMNTTTHTHYLHVYYVHCTA